MARFEQVSPSTESFWRSAILFGRNSASFKFALAKSLLEFAGEQGGRFFNSYDEGSFAALMREQPSLILDRQWQSEGVRRGREKQVWYNALLRKV